MESLSLLHLDSALEFRGGQRQEELLLLGLRERGHRQILLCCPEGGLARRLLGHGLRWAPERLPQPGELLLWPCAARNHPAVALCAAHAAYLWPLALPIAHTAHAHGLWLLAGRRPLVHRRVDFPPRGWLGAWKCKRALGFIAVSSAVRRVLVQAGVPAERVQVVYDGVAPQPTAPPAALGEGPIVLAVGALVDHKDHLTLSRAAQGLPARVLVAGEGPMRAQLQGLELLGHRDDVPALLARAQVFVHPSKEEGLGQVIIEAMLAGVPVVACAAGGVPEVLGNNGLLTPPQDPQALHQALRRALAGDHPPVEAARARAQALFSAEAMVSATEAVYRAYTVASGA